ncbi:MAG: hypothetical protein D3924_14105, partial [Candidatus Electrothrix sp. AR4]|nr:hypothetical protein [Candidatus Electrothrix sp. AR4]
MKKICLVKGGNFVLGIDDQYILSRQTTVGKLTQSAGDVGEKVFHLGSLFSRKPYDVAVPGSVSLHLQKGNEPLYLLVDRVIDDVEVSDQSSPLPPSCPSLAEQLCPQVVLCGNLVVLLLDPAQIIPVSEQLGDRVGWVAEKDFFIAPEKKVEREDVMEDCEPEPHAPIQAETEVVSRSASELEEGIKV